uniref:LisH domain-containing protein n=2 Tax=Mesocestoides corti TaxID=53468 RepID=A0A5K3FC32_MESCO
MFGKAKPFGSPSDVQASEKLALYVYEYLVYSGAQKAAQTFLQEIGWDKHIVPNEAPGFLFSWWSVFWDLYCAAPERRDTLKHSSDARAFYDFGLANPGSVPGGLQPLHLSGPGFHYVQGRNGPPPLLPYQQYVSQQRQLYAPVGSRPCDAKIPGLISMGEQHLDAFLPSSTAAFRPSPNIPSLPIASAPTVTLRHQPRPDGPRGPQVNNGNGGAPVNSSSSAASFSGFSPGGDFQPGPLGTAPQQFGRPQTFHQQRSLPTKLPPCTPNNVVPSQQHWGPSLNHQLSHPADFVSGQSAKVSPDINAATTTMLFDPGLMEPFHPPVSGGEGFTFFEQSDGLPEDSTGGQSITSQISQLLSPSPVQAQRGVSHQQRSLQQSNPNIEEALVLSGPELEMLAGGDDSVEGLEQPVTRASGQGFDCEEIKDSGAPSILFPNDDLQAVQNLVDAMQDPIVGGSLPPPPSQQPFCSLKDTETSAALFLHD